jgi:hypothetical protein
MKNSHDLLKDGTATYLFEGYILVAVNPATWRMLVLKKGRTRRRRLRKNSPPAAVVVYEGDEPGVERCAVWTARSETVNNVLFRQLMVRK